MIQHGKSLIMFFFDRTTSNRKKKPEPEPENEDMADENKENNPIEKKPKIHELPPAKPSTKQSKKSQDHEMTKRATVFNSSQG